MRTGQIVKKKKNWDWGTLYKNRDEEYANLLRYVEVNVPAEQQVSTDPHVGIYMRIVDDSALRGG